MKKLSRAKKFYKSELEHQLNDKFVLLAFWNDCIFPVEIVLIIKTQVCSEGLAHAQRDAVSGSASVVICDCKCLGPDSSCCSCAGMCGQYFAVAVVLHIIITH